MKKKLLFLATFLLLGIITKAQEHFYYYRGEKIYLELDFDRVSVNTQQDSYEYVGEKIKSSTFSNIKQDYVKNRLIDRTGKTPNLEDTFYFEINSTGIQTETEYFNFIKKINRQNQTNNVSPTFKMKTTGNLLGMTDKFYVRLKGKEDFKLLQNFADRFRLNILGEHKYMSLWYILKLPIKSDKTSLYWANFFYESGLFKSAEPEFIYHNLQASFDPLFDDQWYLKNTGQNGGTVGIDINVEPAWNITEGNGVKVAIFDDGFQMNHPDLAANTYGTGYDAMTDTSPAQVRGDHGTPCAGIVGAVQNNLIGISGVAPEAGLISISVNLQLSDPPEALASAFIWAYQNGADIISCSWVRYPYSEIVEEAIEEALDQGRNGKGTVIVFAAGNDDVNGVGFPAYTFDELLVVGAITQCGDRKSRYNSPCNNDNWGSCYGPKLDVMAPGVLISTTANGSPQYMNNFGGTSAACPAVAGVAALVLSINPDLTNLEVGDIIESTARKIRTDLYTYANESGRNNGLWHQEMGYGLVDAYKAVYEAGTLDLYMRNTNLDNGNEPDPNSGILYNSIDMWVRQNDDDGTEHQNAEYNPFTPNYVYVRVHNRGTLPSTINDSLQLHWGKAGTALMCLNIGGTFKQDQLIWVV